MIQKKEDAANKKEREAKDLAVQISRQIGYLADWVNRFDESEPVVDEIKGVSAKEMN